MGYLKNIFLPRLKVEISNETNIDVKNSLEILLKELLIKPNLRKLKGKEIEIIIPKKISETVYKWACKEEKDFYDNNGCRQEANGHFSTPLDYKSSKFKIIINPWTFDDFQYFSTVVHEFIHVLDFNDYIKAYGNPAFMSEEIKRKNYYYEFYFWTEFNAKKMVLKGLSKN